MAARETPGLRYLSQLQHGLDEMQWLQDEKGERRRLHFLGEAWEPGWVGSWLPHGQFTGGWSVNDPGSDGVLRLQTAEGAQAGSLWMRRNSTITPYLGIAPDGQVLELPTEDNIQLDDGSGSFITVPDDATWYTLVAKAEVTTLEPGSLDLTGGSATVTGNRTKFTRYAEGSDPRATKLRIDAANTTQGNEGTYEIVAITDDTTMTVSPAPPATEPSVSYRAKGNFFSGDPADPDIHNNVRVTWELIARTVTPPTDALIVADVMRDTGAQPEAQIIDRRYCNVFRKLDIDHQRRWFVSPIIRDGGTTATGEECTQDRLGVHNAAVSTNDQWVAAAAAGVGADMSPGTVLGADHTTGLLAVVGEQAGAAFDVEAVEYVPFGDPAISTLWRSPDGGGAVNVVTGQAGTCVGLDIVAVPLASGNTHLVHASSDSNGAVAQYSSDDNGATWGSDGAIWDPANFNAGDAIVGGLSTVLTRMGRIILVGSHLTSAASDAELRYIFSDDLGATWDTNSDEGYLLITTAASLDFRFPDIVEDDLGNLWTAYQANDTQIRLVRGGGLNNPVPDAAEIPTDGWRVDLNAQANHEYTRPQLIPCPDGQLLLFFNDRTSGSGSCRVRANLLSRGRIAISTRLMTVADTEALTLDPALCVVQDPGGFIHFLFEDLTSATTDIEDMRYMLVPTARASSLWFGGR